MGLNPRYFNIDPTVCALRIVTFVLFYHNSLCCLYLFVFFFYSLLGYSLCFGIFLSLLYLMSLFSYCSKHTFGEVKIGSTKQNDNIKPWFNSECFFVRNLYHKSRRMHNIYKTAYYKNILKTVGKKYINTLTKTNRNYRANTIKELRSLKKSDPR